MKTKMKKLISIKSVPLFVLALLIVLGTALADGREPVSGSGNVQLVSASDTELVLQGPAKFSVGGEVLEGMVTVTVDLTQTELQESVVHYNWVKHEFTFDDGESTLTTIGEEFAVPTDENPAIQTLHGNMEIMSGTGVFEGASGELRVNGQMNFGAMPPEATFEAQGVICR